MTIPPGRAAFELDHLFVAVSREGPEAEEIAAAGFMEGPPNVHPGQGTACRRFFFENAYLELIWLENLAEAVSETVAPTGLASRTDPTGDASHVGICLRPTDATPSDQGLRTWSYRPSWLPEGMSIPIVTPPGAIDEPFFFLLPTSVAPPDVDRAHPNGARRVTDVRVGTRSGPDWSDGLRWLEASGLVRLERTETESIAIELDGGGAGASLEVTAGARLTLSW